MNQGKRELCGGYMSPDPVGSIRAGILEALDGDSPDQIEAIEYGKRCLRGDERKGQFVAPAESDSQNWFWGVYVRVKEECGAFSRHVFDLPSCFGEDGLNRLLTGLGREFDVPVIAD